MKKSDEKTLKNILSHKEYFDKRLVEIVETSLSAVDDLKDDVYQLKEQNKQLAGEVRLLKLKCRAKDDEIKRIKTYYAKMSDENEDLKRYLKQLEEQIKKDRIEIEEKSKQLDEIIKKNNELYEKINKKIKKLQSSNSTNSNMPSSFDVLSHTVSKANANTRKKTGLKKGGQKGHKVHKSVLASEPDEVVVRFVDKAPSGAAAKVDDNGITYYVTQEIDLRLESHIKETRYYIKETGEKLDKKTAATYAINPCAYTARFKTVAIYLNNKGTIPLQRMCDILLEISNGSIRLKPSTIVKWNQEMHDASMKIRAEILEDILKEGIIHVDETGCKIAKKKYWIHTVTNSRGSYFLVTRKRGDKEAGPVSILKDYEGVVVHDHFKTYQSLDKCEHAECNAHIDRYLRSGIDIDKNGECEEMLELLHRMLGRKNGLLAEGKGEMEEKEIEEFEKKYLEIAQRGFSKYYEKNGKHEKIYEPDYVATFKRMIKYKDDHLRFINDFSVPYTNNAAERQCRVVKSKKKISGQFVSEKSAEAYTDILTLLQTAKLRNENALAYLAQVLS